MMTLTNKTTLTLCCFLILIFPIAFGDFQAQEVDDEHEFSYDEKDVHGPANWGTIRSEWGFCGNGTMQSPIDMLSERVEIVSHLGRLKRSYKSSNATLTNRGHDIMLTWVKDGGHIIINETSYQLRQMHWHSPSEHSINSIRFDLEAHLVHNSTDGKIAVIGILYKIGRPDSFLSMLENDLKILADTKDGVKVLGFVDPKQIKLGSWKYYRYIGSLTTPPCTENVTWTILKKVRTVSKHQVKIIREAVHDSAKANARPAQPLNKRWVKMYRLDAEEQN